MHGPPLWIKHSRVVAGMQVDDWDALDTIRNLEDNEADSLPTTRMLRFSTFAEWHQSLAQLQYRGCDWCRRGSLVEQSVCANPAPACG
jgi:hypothetical protein